MAANEFAGCDEQQSGQRFLNSSAPRLIRQVASCETAAGGEIPLTAGKEEKLFREFEGGALIGREATVTSPDVWDTYPQDAGLDQKLSQGFGDRVPDLRAFGASGIVAASAGFPSLDSLTNNRNNSRVPPLFRRPVGRGKFCGRLSVKGIDPKTHWTTYRRINCGSWSCSYCGQRKARTARAAIRTVAEGLGLRYFLTLTLDPSKLEEMLLNNPKLDVKRFAVPYMRLVFNKFRVSLKRKYGAAPSYICVLEFTKVGLPHLHILFDRYIEQAWVSNVWDSLGGGRICFIKQVTVKNVARYLSRYLTKELLLSAPKGTRRITTARAIKLFPRFASGIAWELQRASIWRCLEQEKMVNPGRQADLFSFITCRLDEENFLMAFELHLPPIQPVEYRPEMSGHRA